LFFFLGLVLFVCGLGGGGVVLWWGGGGAPPPPPPPHVTKHTSPIHNTLSTAPQLSISQKTLGMLPEDRNIMPKHVGNTTHNKMSE
jgi:hypothetical protein